MHEVVQHGPVRPERLWTGPHGRVVVGIFSLAFLVAFEALAVATVMPAVAADLGGLSLYALAFAAPIAVGIVSMTMAGPRMDRRGPGPGLRLGVALFVVGLLVAGLAPSMWVFLAGRAVQGLGMGFVGVGLYVVIGQTFHEDLRARVFTVMTSAWVLPALVGPFVAGAVTDLVGWRWVFLSVPVVAVAALTLIWEALDAIHGDPAVVVDRRRTRWAVAVAAGVLAMGVAGQRTVPWWPVLVLVAAFVTVRCSSRLLPAGAWRARRGLPVVVITRSLLGAAFLAAETYLPLSLVQHRGVSVTTAGLLLTSAALLWFGGAWLSAHVAALASKPLRVRLGAACVMTGVGAGFLTLATAVPVHAVAAVWGIGGLGMGVATSTLGVLVLDHSAPAEQGANSAAMQTSDAVLQSLVLASGAVVFAGLLTEHEQAAYLLVFGGAVAVAALGVVASWRVTTAASSRGSWRSVVTRPGGARSARRSA